nr:TetR/AcrR family transcriptional regulator C-terminal domain-containing protein [Streptomyces albus]
MRIASELRRRIAAGELAPGDRVPSTRQLAREWNVALATATKALTALRLEGLVEARPRAGTVVAPKAPGSGLHRPEAAPAAPPAGAPSTAAPSTAAPQPAGEQGKGRERSRGGEQGRDRELTRDRVVRAAIEIADAEGMGALSMRGVAARLGSATMAAYRHVNGKDDLVLLMADAVLGELPLPPRDAGEPAADWRARLALGARSLWELHRAHPWLAQIGPLTRPLLLPNLMRYSEWMLGALDGHGLPPTTMFNLNVLLYSHIQGLAVQWERENAARGSTGLTEQEWLDQQAGALTSLIASGAYPTFTRLLETLGEDGYDLRLDELFELGLATFLDGVAGLVEGGGGGARR